MGGAEGVGKTQLISSLRTRFLRSFSQPTCGGSYLGPASLYRTYGFCVQRATIPGAGEFSIWDFSGRKEYYPAHEYFLSSRNTIYVIVYSRLDAHSDQLAQVRFWLAMIKAKHRPQQFIHYSGQRGQKPFVVLVQSFADDPPNFACRNPNEDDPFAATSPIYDHAHYLSHSHTNHTRYGGGKLLDQIVDEFGNHFMFTDKIFSLDCRHPRSEEIKALRSLLATLRTSVIKVSKEFSDRCVGVNAWL